MNKREQIMNILNESINDAIKIERMTILILEVFDQPQEERCICSQIKKRVDDAKNNNKELYLECSCGKAYMSVDRPQEEIEEDEICELHRQANLRTVICQVNIIGRAINKINKLNK